MVVALAQRPSKGTPSQGSVGTPQVPEMQVSPAWQVSQASPPEPQAPVPVPGMQVVPRQQPPGQVVLSHSQPQPPFWQNWPA